MKHQHKKKCPKRKKLLIIKKRLNITAIVYIITLLREKKDIHYSATNINTRLPVGFQMLGYKYKEVIRFRRLCISAYMGW